LQCFRAKANRGAAPSATSPPTPLRQLISGTWRLESLKTGKADLDRDLAKRIGDVYRYHPDGTGVLKNAYGEFPFAWQRKGQGLTLRFPTGDFEVFGQVRAGKDRRHLELEGAFDLDYDNRPDQSVMVLASQ
jgi:hypothetical protein